ncbi:glutathione S-transferase [Rhizobium dioscoreae]|uniref:Glutathione S-transferase n=1 Tax=Rhizobium dioscoreae TaxID=2653122 RepID=A0ABQ0Z0H7_9HYPH|nr:MULTISPECIES: glutathione S-transferase [Rhizobium]TWB11376.1 glutathione S-transferase [Rhizobium sp. ERR1071]GES43774.1 glutathione S-transferase [Rhizobium dioscoreae]GES48861.1 glutathione S-transferase [Rhizobium dioscoreae]GLU80304.1 glutathione S-transferase [Rhizobium sp. NBRC 114257]
MVDMRLIGMLDSPFVRRVAISLRALDIAFVHEPLSVFSAFEAFADINPVVKAPSLVTDDGTVLMDSSLILAHAERIAPSGRSLMPVDPQDHARSLRIIGLALAACEKTVQIVYEHKLRPMEKQHQPWLDRIHGQLAAAYRLLEAEMPQADPWLFGRRPLQADITSVVAFRFTREMLPDALDVKACPRLHALSVRAEESAEFRAFPFS